MTMAEKTRENRLRRHATRLGLRVEKSRARLFHVNDRGLWQVRDDRGKAVGGERWDLNLDGLEKLLLEYERKLQRARA